MMTEVSNVVPSADFLGAVQFRELQNSEAHSGYQPPRNAVQGNETFIPRGTPASDLKALFAKREP
jgi:hypothetical protein